MENQSGLNRGAWTRDEDNLLRQCIAKHGEGKWVKIPRAAGLNRCKKSCRLRWLNYLKPDIKRGEFEEDEVDLILRLHKLLGNRWSLIAGRLPGRTANDVKNFWHTNQRREKSRKIFSKTNVKSQETVKPIILRPKPRKLLLTSFLCSTGDDIIGDQIQLKKNNTLLALPAPAAQDFESLESFIETNNNPEGAGLLNEDHIQAENRISCMDLQISEDQLDWWDAFFDNEEVGKTGSGLESSMTYSFPID